MRRFALTIGAAGAMLVSAAGLAAETPYAGQQSRGIKALSQEEITALRNGEGMGLAKAAELNSYPGPRHVLDWSGQLSISDAQIRQVKEVYDRMHAAASSLGAAVIEREQALDRLFANGEITPDRLRAETSAVSGLQGRLRAVHLLAHLETRALLTAAQIAHYNKLRGYDKPAEPAPHHSGTHRH